MPKAIAGKVPIAHHYVETLLLAIDDETKKRSDEEDVSVVVLSIMLTVISRWEVAHWREICIQIQTTLA